MSVFYHGTDIDSAISICDKIVLKKSSKRTDFGPGFIEGIFNPFYSFQYAFHSERALGFINSTRYEKIEREV